MRDRYVLAFAVGALLFAAVVVAIGVGNGAATFTPVDADHPLTQSDAVETFEQDGVVSANVTTIDMGITIAQSHDAADIDASMLTDFNRVYTCFDYREEVSREVRVYIPDDYIQPRTGQSQSLTSDHTVSYDTVEGGNYTAVTVTFDGPARACIGLTKGSGIYFSAKREVRHWLNETTGWSPPSVASSPDWQRLSDAAFRGNASTARLPADRPLTVQYDAAGGESETWLRVPDCSDPSEQTICQYRRGSGGNTSVALLSTADPAPPVRYQYGSGIEADIRSAVRDAQRAVQTLLADIQQLLGGGQ